MGICAKPIAQYTCTEISGEVACRSVTLITRAISSPATPTPRLPAFANLQEAILENMIQNILVEASRGEVVLTSRPRIIALPPVSMHRLGS